MDSYLVSCMFEEAASLSYSTLKRLCNCKFEESVDKDMVEDMIECSGMVLLQAYKELGRVCFLMSEKCLSGLQETLEVFLSSWNYVEQKPCYILRTVDKQQISFEGHICSSLPVEKYVEVTKVYVISLLGVVLDNYELANAQLTKADLPEEERQARQYLDSHVS
ncbi:hypothetical protein EJ110_NYTH13716 [Nymphaea thermarum]|nr:hypothetical protein EJ110_NYTH13716 [Nymphaea thermarum]